MDDRRIAEALSRAVEAASRLSEALSEAVEACRKFAAVMDKINLQTRKKN